LIQLTLQTLALPSTKFSQPFRTYTQQQDTTDDGDQESMSERATAINASVCALMDAGVAMKGMICAVALAILQPTADDQSMNMDTVEIILDPTADEERAAQCTLCIAFSFGEANGGQAGDMCYIETGKGSCSESEVSCAWLSLQDHAEAL
jgi:exosome complex component RRP46